MDEPDLCVPRPSPYPPSRLADTSFSLEVTSERDAQRERKPIRNRGVKKSKFQIPSSSLQVQSTPIDNLDHIIMVHPTDVDYFKEAILYTDTLIFMHLAKYII